MTDRPSAVRLYAPDHPALTNTVRAKLMKRRADLLDAVMSSQDWADFSYRRGEIRATDAAIAECEQAEKDYRKS